MSATRPISPEDLVRIRSDSSISFYLDRITEAEQEIEKIRLDLELSDRIAAVSDLAVWKDLTDRLRTVESEDLVTLRKRELSPYRQGYTQGRLDVIDRILNLKRMTPQEIEAANARIRTLQNQIEEHKEVLR